MQPFDVAGSRLRLALGGWLESDAQPLGRLVAAGSLHTGIRVLFTADQIAARVRELGLEPARDYEDKNPLYVGVLKGDGGQLFVN